tara:strand:- start:582 stop:848 length:267 start_codon:yes stop_codon:yes gene_type:complete
MTTIFPLGKTIAPHHIQHTDKRRERLAQWDTHQSYQWLRPSGLSPYVKLSMALFGVEKNNLGEADYESYFAENGWAIDDIVNLKSMEA